MAAKKPGRDLRVTLEKTKKYHPGYGKWAFKDKAEYNAVESTLRGKENAFHGPNLEILRP